MTGVYAPPNPPIALVDADVPVFVARWRRVGAFVLDTCLWVLVLNFVRPLVWANQAFYIACIPAIHLAFVFYTFYMHGKSGQTIGKRLFRIRVVRTDGSAMGFVRSGRRCLILILESIPDIAAKMIALSQIPASLYNAADIQQMRQMELQFRPAWDDAATIFVCALLIADLVSWIYTKRRQTLADLIADTVVVNVPKKINRRTA